MKVTTTKIAGHKALRYQYSVGGGMTFDFNLLCEVGEPYQKQAKRAAETLANDRGCIIRYDVEIDEAPWMIDVAEKDFK